MVQGSTIDVRVLIVDPRRRRQEMVLPVPFHVLKPWAFLEPEAVGYQKLAVWNEPGKKVVATTCVAR